MEPGTFTYTAADADNVSGDGDEASLTFTIKNNGDTGAAAVALASDPGDDNTYAAGETVRVAVTFSEAVDVDHGGRDAAAEARPGR